MHITALHEDGAGLLPTQVLVDVVNPLLTKFKGASFRLALSIVVIQVVMLAAAADYLKKRSVNASSNLVDISAAAAIGVDSSTEGLCNSYTTADIVLDMFATEIGTAEVGFKDAHGSCNLSTIKALTHSVDAHDMALLNVSERVTSFWGPLLLEAPMWERIHGYECMRWRECDYMSSFNMTAGLQYAIDHNFSAFVRYAGNLYFKAGGVDHCRRHLVKSTSSVVTYMIKNVQAQMCSNRDRVGAHYDRARRYAKDLSWVDGTKDLTVSHSKPETSPDCPKVCKDALCPSCMSSSGYCGVGDAYC